MNEISQKPFSNESSESNNKYLWQLMIELYQKDVDKFGDPPEMLNLVKYLSEQKDTLEFYPNRSIGNLCIRRDYFPHKHGDTLVVSWNKQQKSYQLLYCEVEINKQNKRMCENQK